MLTIISPLRLIYFRSASIFCSRKIIKKHCVKLSLSEKSKTVNWFILLMQFDKNAIELRSRSGFLLHYVHVATGSLQRWSGS